MHRHYTNISYLLAVAVVLLILRFHLVPAVFAGLTVYVLTMKVALLLPKNMNRFAHKVALGVVSSSVVLCLASACTAIWSFIGSSTGIPALLNTILHTLGSMRNTVPEPLADILPSTIEDLRELLVEIMGSHVQKISVAGMESVKVFAHIILGMVVGGMAALHHFFDHDKSTPFIAALRSRLRNLAMSFDKVVFAQVKISALNTTFTGIYLLIALPLFGIEMPMATILVLITFAVGLLPVVGNLISNTLIFLVGLGVSPAVGASSLLFLILIHKVEYFLNAKIVGKEVQATAWELLSAMLLLEAIFGVTGLVAAPVVYAWLKAEVKQKEMI